MGSIRKAIVSAMLAATIAVTGLGLVPVAEAAPARWPTHARVYTNGWEFKTTRVPYFEIVVRAQDWRGAHVKGHVSLWVNGKFERRRSLEWGWRGFRIDRGDLPNDRRSRIQVRIDPSDERRKIEVVTKFVVDRTPKPKPPRVTSTAARVVEAARSIVGRGYRWGEDGPRLFDCSGAVKYAYATVGIRLPHSSAAQSRLGRRVSRPAPGDLVYIPGHIAIYVGNGRIV